MLLWSQFFSLTLTGELRQENFCAEIQNPLATPVQVIMFHCHGQKGNQEWRMEVGTKLSICQSSGYSQIDRSWVRSVSTVIGYRLEKGLLFWVGTEAVFLGVKQQVHEAHHSSASSAA